MGVIGIILLVVFIIVCLLLVGIVLIQNEEGSGMGGLFGGANSQAFGARSGNVLTKTTYILVTLFFVVCLGLALLNKAPASSAIDKQLQQNSTQTESTESEPYWQQSADTAE